ncbi:MAG TPA: DUF1592 domain-containing protein [Hyphomicrobiales bacterium]|nr:DUF1592 domain-containing protein [Hyphomicrobiales bacterium]
MNRAAFPGFTLRLLPALLLGLGGTLAQGQALEDSQGQLVDRYCSECHNLEDFSGGFAFELVDRADVHNDAQIWEKVIRKLNAGMMPPPGQERPSENQIHALVANIEQAIDAHAEAHPTPGAPLLRRLNRTEYQNAIRDLLDLPIDASELMPADDSSGGFDNVANVLSISPVLLESYIAAASKISRLAVGDMNTVAAATTYRTDGQSQAMHKEGLALGTRGGLSVEHVFPLDAEYEITVARGGANNAFALTPFGENDPVEIVVDGERVALLQPQDRGTIRIPLTGGVHRIDAAYLPLSPGLGVDDLHSVWATSTGLGNLSIRGPLDATGPGDTASRRRIFVCQPEAGPQEAACAKRILEQLATRAYRRPVDQPSLDILLSFYEDGRERGGFETGIQYALARLLVDPQFIFRFEAEPENLPVGAIYAVDDYELASRLSFFLWSSIPDARLLELAGQGRLGDQGVLEAEVARMLLDPKAESLVTNFATQWLSLRKLDAANPVSTDFDNALRDAMLKETQLLFANVLHEDDSIIDFLDANYTYVNERLAQHYGLPGIRGSHFRKVPLPAGARRGLLGHSSILTITSAPNRTSPVIRGTWILENLLGTPPPSPPPGVETNLDVSVPLDGRVMTIREQLERHRADPSCAACHSVIDPLGFALENYDAIGKWRDEEGGSPVNTHSRLWDGTPLDGPQGLHAALMTRQGMFVEAFIEKLMTYALGRRVEYYDMPAIREVTEQAQEQDYRLGAIVQGIVNSVAFRMRTKADNGQTDVALASEAATQR